MNDVYATVLTKGAIWLCISTLLYMVMNGAQIFETFVVVPRWTAAPPESLYYLNGKYALDLKTFWIVIHSIHEVTFILAVIFCWRLEIRNPLLVLFAIHFAVRMWTILYFAPNIMAFQHVDILDSRIENLVGKAKLWQKLNYLRVAIFVAVSIGLIPLCLKVLNLAIR